MSNRVFSPLKSKPEWNLERFSVTLLEKEIELEKNFSLSAIQDLITLYSEAIEHYNEQSDPKFYDYHHKLQSLLLIPEVSSVLSNKNLSNFYSFSKRKNFFSQQLAKSKVLERNFSLPKKNLNESFNQQNSVKMNVSKQENDLGNRIQARKSRKMNESVSPGKGASVDQRIVAMEQVYEEKARDVAQITLLYLKKIEAAEESEKKVLAKEMKEKILAASQKYSVSKDLRIKQLGFINKTRPNYY